MAQQPRRKTLSTVPMLQRQKWCTAHKHALRLVRSTIMFGVLSDRALLLMLVHRYEGEFAEGKMQGQGAFTFEDRGCFTGTFRSNKKHGQGSMLSKDGERWEGMWVDDSRQGTVSSFRAAEYNVVCPCAEPTNRLLITRLRWSIEPTTAKSYRCTSSRPAIQLVVHVALHEEVPSTMPP